MTLMTLCALAPPMCRAAADPSVRAALLTLAASPGGDPAPLARAMQGHPDDAARILTLLGGRSSPLPETLRQCFTPEVLAFFHLCGQCTAEEMLAVLTRCTVPPTAEGLALLIGARRREAAMARYGLQLLWRLNGDPSLPDALTLFPEAHTPARTSGAILVDTLRRLKEDDP